MLEDVHWADAPTLLLLRHLARAGDARVLLLATFRDTEADVPPALAETLADLRRYDVVRLRLPGSPTTRWRSSSGAPRAATTGRPRSPRRIRELTEGNPFLVCELWRALIETGAVELSGGGLRVHRAPLASWRARRACARS